MPLVRIDHAPGKPASYREALSKGVHAALQSVFGVPEHDLFHILREHGPGTIRHAPNYLGIDYSDELVILQITVNDGRTLEQKKTLFATIADNLARDPGVRRQDVMINLLEVKKENWSFGNGLAQYAPQ